MKAATGRLQQLLVEGWPMSPLPYADAAAFRRALLTRLKSEAAVRGVSMQTLQQRLLMERMLVRLFSDDDVPWVLKGGFALDLRFRPRARVTRDLDLGVEDALATDDLRDQLESALASVPDESDDFLVFTVGRSSDNRRRQRRPLCGTRPARRQGFRLV